MNIVSGSLSRDDVVLGLDVPNKLRALEEAALIVERNHDVNHAAVFRAYNQSQPGGVSATQTVHVFAQPTVHYVDAGYNVMGVPPAAYLEEWAAEGGKSDETSDD